MLVQTLQTVQGYSAFLRKSTTRVLSETATGFYLVGVWYGSCTDVWSLSFSKHIDSSVVWLLEKQKGVFADAAICWLAFVTDGMGQPLRPMDTLCMEALTIEIFVFTQNRPHKDFNVFFRAFPKVPHRALHGNWQGAARWLWAIETVNNITLRINDNKSIQKYWPI